MGQLRLSSELTLHAQKLLFISLFVSVGAIIYFLYLSLLGPCFTCTDWGSNVRRALVREIMHIADHQVEEIGGV